MSVLNADQHQAFQEVINFVNDPSEKYHRISGGPGTGKSFFITKIAENILKHQTTGGELKEVQVTATTNKAVAVLKKDLNNVKTIYGFMNLRVSANYNTGEARIVPTKRWTIHRKTLIIIDEASMVPKSLFHYLETGTDATCKILFVGDRDQLDPVKESTSKAFSLPFQQSTLMSPVRQQNQPHLMELVRKAKDTVETGKFFKIEEVPGVIDYVNGTQTQGLIERDYHTETHKRRILCYTNARVTEYNSYVRKIRGYTRFYEVGEILTNNESAELTDKSRLYADQVVRIIKREDSISNDQIIGGEVINVVPLVVEDVETNQQYHVTCFENPQERHEVIKFFQRKKSWDKYFHFKENYPDLRSCAASTIHKAQGSTYDDVIVDLKDIGKCTQIEMAARLLYVALSRPKERLYLRGQLPDRYFKS